MKRIFSIAFVLACFLATLMPLWIKEDFLRDFLRYAFGTHLLALALIVLTGVFLVFKHKLSKAVLPPLFR